MKQGFVWFHNNSEKPAESRRFYEALLGWQASDGPGGSSMFGGEAGPFAGLSAASDAVSGWVPYVQVPDVEAAAARATQLGARVLQAKTRGPAGEFAVVRDPGGAALALWQKA